jgi:hypothetical protein
MRLKCISDSSSILKHALFDNEIYKCCASVRREQPYFNEKIFEPRDFQVNFVGMRALAAGRVWRAREHGM